MKKVGTLLILLVLSASIMFAGGQTENSSSESIFPRIMTFGTAGTGGAYYPVGVCLGSLFEKYLPTRITVEITGGALENPLLLSQGELDIAMTNEHIGYFAEHQMPPYENLTDPNFSVLAAGLQPGVLHFAVAGDSDIETPYDLKGKVIAVGTQGNGSLSTIEAILKYYGITFNDFTPSYMNYTEGCQGVIDGTVDCCIVPAGIPVSSIQQLAAAGKPYRLLNMPDREGFIEENPFYVSFDLPANTYSGQSDTVETFATANVIIVRGDLSEDVVYELTKCLWEHIDEVYQTIPGLKDSLKLENALDTTVTVHPGALKYYKEVGLIS